MAGLEELQAYLNNFDINIKAYHFERKDDETVDYITWREDIETMEYADDRVHCITYNVDIEFVCKTYKTNKYKYIAFLEYMCNEYMINSTQILYDDRENFVTIRINLGV